MPKSRTLLVELHLDNPNNQIQPGTYAQIVTLPNNADSLVTVDIVCVATTAAPSPTPAMAKK
jgi:hypothetical protein